MALDIIKQTNRTILFEEFNSEGDNILSILGSGDEYQSIPGKIKQEINQKLLVGSFEEFIQKFTPSIYSYFNMQKGEIIYTINKPSNIPEEYITKTILDSHHPVLKMIFRIMDSRKGIGQNLLEFDFEKITSMLSPKSIVEDVKLARKELENLYLKFEDMEDVNPEKHDLAQKLNEKFLGIRVAYGNPLNLLPVAIEDTKERLQLKSGNSEDCIVEGIKIGYTKFAENGSLELIEYKTEEQVKSLPENKVSRLIGHIESDYEQNSVVENKSKFVRDLIVRTYVPNAQSKLCLTVEEEKYNYTQYVQMYKKDKENFIDAARELIKKILGIKVFFDQAQVENNDQGPTLIITNCSLELACKNKNKIEKYLDSVNNITEYENSIWFAIVPNVALEKKNNELISGPFSVNNNLNAKKESNANSIQSLAELLAIMKKYRVQTFFNFEANEETSFEDVEKHGLDKYKDKTKDLVNKNFSDVAIVCLPNFTILPKYKSVVELANKVSIDMGGKAILEDKEKMTLNGIYLDAAYVAAGITAAYQSPHYLKSQLKSINANNPGVRFNIEENRNNLKFTTTLSKEIDGFTNNIINEINSNNFGFVFSSNNYYLDGKLIDNIVVYKARSLNKNGDYFQPIFEITTMTYMHRILRAKTNDFQKKEVKRFFEHMSGQMKSWEQEMSQNYDNLIITQEDKVEHYIDEEGKKCSLKLQFGGQAINLDVEIN